MSSRHGGKAQLLHHHGAAGRLPIAAGKARVAHTLAFGALEFQRHRELARRRDAVREHGIETTEVEEIVGLVAPQVQVHGAVGGGRRLLEQQQALQQRRFARRVGAQQHGHRGQPHGPTVAPGFEVLQVEELDHGKSILDLEQALRLHQDFDKKWPLALIQYALAAIKLIPPSCVPDQRIPHPVGQRTIQGIYS